MSPLVIATGQAFGIAPERLWGKARWQASVMARAAAVALIRERRALGRDVPMSYQVIGGLLGLRDHASVIYLERRAADFESDADWRDARDRLALWIDRWLAGRAGDPDATREPRHPAVLTRRIKPKNEHAANDRDAMARFRAANALIAAITREHPERTAA